MNNMEEKYKDIVSILFDDIRKARLEDNYTEELLFRMIEINSAIDLDEYNLNKLIYHYPENSTYANEIKKDLSFLKSTKEALYIEYGIIRKMCEAKEKAEQNAEKSEKKKTNVKFAWGFGVTAFAFMLAGVNVAVGLSKKSNGEVIANMPTGTIESVISPDIIATPEPTAVSISKDEQIKKDAKDIYENYINQEHLPEEFKKTMTLDIFENMTRMMRGEFMLDSDGQIDYNDMQFDDLGNFHDRYYGSTSFRQLENNLIYIESAPFFEEGSIAKELVKSYDVVMKSVYEAIRNDDVEAFKLAAYEYAEFLRDAFIPTMSNGNVIDINSVETEYKYAVASVLLTAYGPTVMEYQGARDIDICIPYCYNADKQLEGITLSKLIYTINELPLNTMAQRAGMASEWEEANDPIIVHLGKQSRAYFRSMYNQEVEYIYEDPYGDGYQRTLR